MMEIFWSSSTVGDGEDISLRKNGTGGFGLMGEFNTILELSKSRNMTFLNSHTSSENKQTKFG